MKAKNIEDILEKDGFELETDNTDVLGYGCKTYAKNDGKELVQVTVCITKAED